MKCINSKHMFFVGLMMVAPACGMQQESLVDNDFSPNSLQKSVATIISVMSEDEALRYIEQFAYDMRSSVEPFLDGRCGKKTQKYAKEVMRETEALLSGVEWATDPSANNDSKQYWISFFIDAYDLMVEKTMMTKNSALIYQQKKICSNKRFLGL